MRLGEWQETPVLENLRQKFPWFPNVDADLCQADLQCLNFCPHDVFEWDPQTGQPVVAHPLRCLPGCEICLEGCVTGAISLPTKEEFQFNLNKLRRASFPHAEGGYRR
jgi:NAD-dependent dihydropyrimidine dehydrogenase PreA subunit